MADITFRGGAAATAYTNTMTASGTGGGSPAALGIAINGKEVSVSVTNGMTAAQFAAAFAAALQASAVPEFAADLSFAYTAGAAVVTATGREPGVPVTIAAGAGGGTVNGITLALSPTQATGPSDLANTANYGGGALPTNSDDLTIAPGAPDILYGLTALSGVSLASLTIPAGYTGRIGLPYLRDTGAGQAYPEYRTRYLTLGGDPTVTIGQGDGAGSGRILLAAGTGTMTLNVYGTAQRLTPDVPAVNWDPDGNGNVLNVVGGDVGLGAEQKQSARVATLRTAGGAGGPAGAFGAAAGTRPAVSAARVTLGPAATVDAADVDGGTVDAYGTSTAVTITAGTWTQWAGTLPAVTCDGGTVAINVSGVTVTTATFRDRDAVCDLSGAVAGVTFTDHTFVGGAALNDPNKRLTFTNAGTWDTASVRASNFGNGQFSLKRS